MLKKSQIPRTLLNNKKLNFALLKKDNNSLAPKTVTNLLNNRTTFINVLSTQHNSTTKMCCTLFKNENERKIS